MSNGSENVSFDVHEGKLKIEVDLSVNLGPSASGKTILIAKSGKAIPIDSSTYFQLTVYRYPERK